MVINNECLFLVQVRELLWNSDSTVLAVWMEDLKAENGHPNTYSKMKIKQSVLYFPNFTLRFLPEWQIIQQTSLGLQYTMGWM